MRAFSAALAFAFILGSFASVAQATCAYGHAKKNDFETPPPAASAEKSTDKKG